MAELVCDRLQLMRGGVGECGVMSALVVLALEMEQGVVVVGCHIIVRIGFGDRVVVRVVGPVCVGTLGSDGAGNPVLTVIFPIDHAADGVNHANVASSSVIIIAGFTEEWVDFGVVGSGI